jgi:hypothetical protein
LSEILNLPPHYQIFCGASGAEKENLAKKGLRELRQIEGLYPLKSVESESRLPIRQSQFELSCHKHSKLQQAPNRSHQGNKERRDHMDSERHADDKWFGEVDDCFAGDQDKFHAGDDDDS